MLLPLLLSAILGVTATALPTPLYERDFSPSTDLSERGGNWNVVRNDLINGPCKPVTLIFARGTIELGNVGALAGPPFFNALSSIIGDSNLAVQGVDYGATIEGFLAGGDPAGAAQLASLTNLAASKCPSTQIVVSGYSQGAQVAHLGLKQISAATASRISAVVFFGDPNEGQAIDNIADNREKTYCFETDLICDGLAIVLPAHLSYSIDAIPAAQFVAGLVQV